MEVGGQRFVSEEETRYQLYRRLGGPKGQSKQVRNITPPPPPAGFNSRIIQTLASSYTDYARSGQTVDHDLPADRGRFLVSMKICRLIE